MSSEIENLKNKYHKYSNLIWMEDIFRNISSEENTTLDIRWEHTKIDNLKVPVYYSSGKQIFFNSEYNPIVESRKILDTFDPCDFLLIIGIEGGFLAKCLYDYSHKFKRIIIIECLQELLIQTLLNCELDAVFSLSNISFHLINTISEMLPLLSNLYQPHIYQSLRIFIKPSMSQVYRDLNINIENECKIAIEAIHNDFVTQARFGKRWLYNFLCNIRLLPYKEVVQLPITHELVIIGAGPSLESQKNKIKKLSEQGIAVWAVDAALNWCHYHTINVQAFLSIDGQSVSYIHLFKDNLSQDDNKICAGDLLSNPIYFRKNRQISTFISNHPLLHYYNNFAKCFNSLNTDGGNVGQSLVALASSFGVHKLHVFGLDFAYLNGKPYAQPGFYFKDSIKRSNRCKPYELNLAILWLDNQLIAGNDKDVIQTERFGNYLNQFENYLDSQSSEIISHSNTWKSRPIASSFLSQPVNDMKKEGVDFKLINQSFVKSYVQDLKTLRSSNFSIQDIFESKYTREKQTFLTLMPLIAWYKAFLVKNEAQNSDISNRALSLAIEHAITRFGEHFSSEES